MLTHDIILDKKYNKKQKDKLNITAKEMENGISKEELMQKLNVHERVARDILNAVGFVFPVYSEPNNNGKHIFKIAKNGDDVMGNEHKIYDRLSRVEEMLYSIIPNIEFEEKNNIDLGLKKEIDRFLGFLAQPKLCKYKMYIDDYKTKD